MISLGSLTLNGIPRIAVGFTDNSDARVVAEAKERGLDVAELRIDQYKRHNQEYVLNQISKFKGFPTIATIRMKDEGGAWTLSEGERLELFKAVIPYVDAVDIELRAEQIRSDVVAYVHENNKLAVISYHDFSSTPDLDKLNDIANEAKSLGADIIKIATTTNSKKDVQILASFTITNAEKNLITIGMGSDGLVTRFLFPALGSIMTFAYVGQPTAPGQLNFDATFDMLRQFYPAFNQEKISTLQLVENF